MANDCHNNFTITHDDPAMIERFRRGWEAGGVFNEFIPMPDELRNAESPCRDDKLKALNIEKYGAECWYEWSIKNWGNKRDAGKYDGDIWVSGNGLYGRFSSAWRPPIEAFIKLGELGFRYQLTYDEPGFGISGTISWDGVSEQAEHYQYDLDMLKDEGLDWRDVIPK